MKARTLAAALLIAAICPAPTMAQSSVDAGKRLELSGAFISANEMMAALETHCPGNYGDAPYGAAGALIKLHEIVRRDEFATLADYINSDAYAQDQLYVQGRVRSALGNIRATADAAVACRTLATKILESYATAKAALQGLR